jgi:NhaP-type Na+/H+ or K+/H+ antiporter
MNILGLDENNKIRKEYVDCPLWKRCVLRFVRVFLGSFASGLAIFLTIDPQKWTSAMLLSAVISALSAGFVALDKFIRDYEESKI